MFSTAPPFPIFNDVDGKPLESGYLYYGTVNLNPETHPITVYWDSTGTQPAAQPIRTMGGFPVRNGKPATVFVGSDYAITVKDRHGKLVYSSSVSNQIQTGFTQAGTGAVLRTSQNKMRDIVNVKDFIPEGTNIVTTDCRNYIQAAHDALVAAGGGVLLFSGSPSFRCDSGLNLDVSLVKFLGFYTLLDQSHASTNVIGITVGATVGLQSLNQTPGGIEGLNMLGPSESLGTSVGILLDTAGVPGPAFASFRNFSVQGYHNADISVYRNAYLNVFDNLLLSGALASVTSGVGAGGGLNSNERMHFINCTFRGGPYGIVHSDSGGDYMYTGCSFDTSADANGAALYFDDSTFCFVVNCHFECKGSAVRVIPIGGGRHATISIVNSRIMQNNTPDVTVPFFNCQGATYLHFFGCSINAYATTHRAVYMASGRYSQIGTHFQFAGTLGNAISGCGNNIFLDTTDSVDASTTSGRFNANMDFNAGNSRFLGAVRTTCTVADTWYPIADLATMESALFQFRDTTAGGTAVFTADAAVHAIYNGIANFEMRYNAGNYEIRIAAPGTGGHVIAWAALGTP